MPLPSPLENVVHLTGEGDATDGAERSRPRYEAKTPIDALDFHDICEVAGGGIAVLDPHGTLLYVNRAIERIVERDLHVFVGQNMHVFASEWQFAVVAADGATTRPFTQAIRTRQPVYDVLVSQSRADGSQVWFAVDFVPVMREGVLRYIVLSFTNVTGQKEKEAALRANYEQLRVVLEHAPIGTCIINDGGMFEMVNGEFCAIFGVEAVTLVGQSYLSLLPPAMHPAVAARLGGVSADGDFPDELETTASLGSPKRLRTASASFTGADGRPRVAVFLQDITTQSDSRERLTRLALYDELTGLPNRMSFNERLTQTLADARQAWQMVSVLFVDFDGFKRVNDKWGHDAGDTVLRTLAQRLRACVHESDDVARRGGDEFLVMMPTFGAPEDAATLAREIIRTCSEPITVEGRGVQLGVSVGIALFPFDGQDAVTLIAAADRAMYMAKRGGKGTYVFAQRDDTA